MLIIARYITKEIGLSFLGITAILLLIVLSNRFALYLTKAATGELPISLIFHMMGLWTPELLSYLIPLGLFLALLFTYGRLYAESEMTVLFACGVSYQAIIKITLGLAVAVMLLTASLTLWIVPHLALKREKLLSKGEAFGVIQSLLPGRFQAFADDRFVFYIEGVEPKSEMMQGVLIAEHPTVALKNEKGFTWITASAATVKQDKKSQKFYVVLKNGHRYQGFPGTAEYTVTDFEEYGRTIEPTASPMQSDSLRSKPSAQLFKSNTPSEAAELQWRLSLPLTVVILALLALPLSYVRSRQGRFAKFFPALALYIVYYNFFTISRRWVEALTLPSFIGVWWVHLLFFFIALGLIAKRTGWLRRRG